ncbi:hypothetical protein [Polymorphospora lycopeni]|uniref:ATP-binding protein n=1 Tax=Polymorphospora lycopeni TaxID=3140240 RepID=A0ABV5CKH6_9ACTN
MSEPAADGRAPADAGPASAPPAGPDPAPDRAEDLDDALHGELRDSARFVNVQYFNGRVDASGATFGGSFGPGRRPGSATGPLRQEDVDAALRHYVRPEPYARARRLLLDRRLVVLCGPAGIGKYSGAIALLRDVAGRDGLPTNLSPALAFSELAGQKFGNASGYIVRDQARDANTVAVQQFELHRLLGALKNRSYLVITVDLGLRPRGQLADLMVDWSAPDSDELFDTCTAHLTDQLRHGPGTDEVREQVRRLHSPGEVVAVCELMTDGPRKALAAFEDSQRGRVASWFDQDPEWPEVLAVAALAFVEGTPEADFERLVARLTELHRQASGASAALPAAGQPPDAAPTRQVRLDRRRAGGLITVRPSPQAGAGSPAVEFQTDDMRPLVLGELRERYGYALWEPLRNWLHEIAATAPVSDLQVRLGMGMAVLSRFDFQEVEHTFLDRWAAGLAAERAAAACTLSWIGLDGSHAASALTVTKRWALNSGQRRAVTAATALGGPLGLRYPSDALRWLWTLAMRNARIRPIACDALGILFAVTASDPAATRKVLNFLHHQMRDAVEDGASQRDRRATYPSVLEILAARDPRTDEPVAALVLRGAPRNADRLGALWADLLASAPQRRQARTALLVALGALSEDTAALPAVRRFGAAIRGGLSHSQWRALEAGLEEGLLRIDEEAAREGLLSTVFAALRGRRTQNPSPHHLTGRSL